MIKHYFFLVFAINVELKIKKMFKEEDSIETLTILGLINDIQKYQTKEENLNQEFGFNNKYGTRNYFLKELNQNELISQKEKKFWTTLNYIKHISG